MISHPDWAGVVWFNDQNINGKWNWILQPDINTNLLAWRNAAPQVNPRGSRSSISWKFKAWASVMPLNRSSQLLLIRYCCQRTVLKKAFASVPHITGQADGSPSTRGFATSTAGAPVDIIHPRDEDPILLGFKHSQKLQSACADTAGATLAIFRYHPGECGRAL